MSCQISDISHISIVDQVRAKLGLIESSSAAASTTDEYGDDNWNWEWQEQASSRSRSNSASKDINWPQKCCISLSPTGKVLAIAHQKNIVILNAYLDSRDRETRTEYNVISSGNICEAGEEITSVLCTPLLSQLKSSPSGTDWTCVIVGFSSGFVRFYTEDKKLLAGEQLHNEPVIHLKCQSFRRASHSASPEQPEELYVLYPSVVVTMPGFSLFQTLRACRNQLARVQASKSGSIEAPPLAHTKWGFAEQEVVKDCQVVGSTTVNTYDHLMTASVCGGPDAVVKSSAPAHSLVVAIGRKPYVGYHYTFEGNTQPILLGVARAMANTIKSSQGLLAIKNYFSGSKSTPDKKAAPAIDPAEPMGCRFGLCDLWRKGEAIVMSPSRAVSAVCDSLGRVILLDNHKGVALRMWKGYRDAQCGWIEVKEPSRSSSASTSSKSKHRPRVALFLAIYSPKKGIIEVWAMQQGPKVASFIVSKGGRLLYTSYGHVGVNNVPVKGSSRSQFPCIYMDPSGALKEITVPFHFALSAQNSKQARDMHLLKKLRQLLRECRDGVEDSRSVEEVGGLAQDLWSSEAGLQALDVLTASKNTQPAHMQAALNSLLNKLKDQDPELMDHGTKTLLHNCQQLLKLSTFYSFLQDKNSQPPAYESVISVKTVTPAELSVKLSASEREMESLLALANDVSTIGKAATLQPRVTFKEDSHSLFTEFVSSFEISSVSTVHKRPLSLKNDIPDERIKKISMQIFQGWLHSESPMSEWLEQAAESGIEAQSLLNLAIHFWLQSHQYPNAVSNLGTEILRFTLLVKGICSLGDPNQILVDCNELSSWWGISRDILTNSDQPLRALTAAVVCRGVGLCLENSAQSKCLNDSDNSMSTSQDETLSIDDETPNVSGWEQLSMDTIQWNELVRQLEDLSFLDAVLQQKLQAKLHCLPHHLRWKAASVSLRAILNTGKGAVSELVAGWLASTGLKPQMLLEVKEENNTQPSSPPKPINKPDLEVGVEAANVDPEASSIMDLINNLRQHFRFSLSSNPLLASLFWEFIQDRSQIMNNPVAGRTSLDILKVIPSPHLRQGMCSLLWTLYLKQDFEKISRSMSNKTKMNFEEMGLQQGHLSLYLDFIVQFLEAFLEANEESEVESSLELESEELWSQREVAPSLSQVALSKPATNFDLLELHLQLATVLHMVAVFEIKISSIISSLFDSAGQAAFFSELSSHPRLPSHNPDQKLTSSRTQFLCRVISASMQTIEVVDAGDPSDLDTSAPKVDATVSAQWMRKCLILANSWSVSSDILRRHQICDLYMTGYDRLAEEILSSISDEALLGSQLLLIAGQRLQLAISNSADLAEKMSNIGPALSTWLQNVEVGSQVCASSLSDTAQLVGHVARLLPDGHSDSWLVQMLLDSCQHFTSTEERQHT